MRTRYVIAARVSGISTLVLIYAVALVAAQNTSPPPLSSGLARPSDIDGGCEFADGCGKAHALIARLRAGLEPSDDDRGGGDREALGDTDLLHSALDIEIVPATATITGTNTMTVQSKVEGLTQFTFRLRNQFTITAALLNGTTPVQVTSTSTTTRMAMLDRPYHADEVFTLMIAYTGVAVPKGFGSIEFTSQNGQPLIFTLSEPYYAYTWWPIKDGDMGDPGDNSDKMTVELAVTAPDALRTISNGLLQGVDVLPGGRTRYRWATNYPIATYLICFSSTNYNQWTKTYDYGTGTMPVEFSIFPTDDTPGHRAAWEKCVDMLAVYRTIYGLYPFINEKYGIYEFGFGGGMEHQTYTGEGTFSENVTAHELSHQWWGDNVTCKT